MADEPQEPTIVEILEPRGIERRTVQHRIWGQRDHSSLTVAHPPARAQTRVAGRDDLVTASGEPLPWFGRYPRLMGFDSSGLQGPILTILIILGMFLVMITVAFLVA